MDLRGRTVILPFRRPGRAQWKSLVRAKNVKIPKPNNNDWFQSARRRFKLGRRIGQRHFKTGHSLNWGGWVTWTHD
eukprot:651156-Rhodomonas_salina.3